MAGRGVKLEQDQEKKAILKRGIVDMPAPEGFSVPLRFERVRGEPDPKRILRAADAAGVRSETDGTPLREFLKSLAEQKTQLLVARCYDDDPFAAGAQAVLRESPEKVADGLALAAKACGAEETLIAAASRAEKRHLSSRGLPAAAVVAGSRSPADFFLLRRLRRGGKTAALIGAQACAALSDAVREGTPQTETVVTVTGNAAGKPGNYRVYIGTPLSALLKFCEADARAQFVAVGSALAGHSLRDLSMPVGFCTHCVTVLKKPPLRPEFACVRCGRCAKACPSGVVPWLVHRELESAVPEPLLLFHVGDCIGCRACSAVCPSGIDLAGEVRRAALIKEGGHAV